MPNGTYGGVRGGFISAYSIANYPQMLDIIPKKWYNK